MDQLIAMAIGVRRVLPRQDHFRAKDEDAQVGSSPMFDGLGDVDGREGYRWNGWQWEG